MSLVAASTTPSTTDDCTTSPSPPRESDDIYLPHRYTFDKMRTVVAVGTSSSDRMREAGGPLELARQIQDDAKRHERDRLRRAPPGAQLTKARQKTRQAGGGYDDSKRDKRRLQNRLSSRSNKVGSNAREESLEDSNVCLEVEEYSIGEAIKCLEQKNQEGMLFIKERRSRRSAPAPARRAKIEPHI